MLIGTVNFVAYNRVAGRAQVHPNLMSAPRVWNCANQREFVRLERCLRRSRPTTRSNKTPLDVKFSLRRCATRMDHLF